MFPPVAFLESRIMPFKVETRQRLTDARKAFNVSEILGITLGRETRRANRPLDRAFTLCLIKERAARHNIGDSRVTHSDRVSERPVQDAMKRTVTHQDSIDTRAALAGIASRTKYNKRRKAIVALCHYREPSHAFTIDSPRESTFHIDVNPFETLRKILDDRLMHLQAVYNRAYAKGHFHACAACAAICDTVKSKYSNVIDQRFLYAQKHPNPVFEAAQAYRVALVLWRRRRVHHGSKP